MVRLKVQPVQAIEDPLAHFNSTMVRLKVREVTVEPHSEYNFNSTMVRLKGDLEKQRKAS